MNRENHKKSKPKKGLFTAIAIALTLGVLLPVKSAQAAPCQPIYCGNSNPTCADSYLVADEGPTFYCQRCEDCVERKVWGRIEYRRCRPANLSFQVFYTIVTSNQPCD